MVRDPAKIFEKNLIAPCGINCGTCYAYLREKNRCHGCRYSHLNKPQTRLHCKIKTCEKQTGTDSGFCCDCTAFPCTRLKNIDKRYRIRYKTSLINNLVTLKETGITKYLELEVHRWTCRECGSVLSVHNDKCMNCGTDRCLE